MQVVQPAKSYPSGSVSLSTEVRGKPRDEPRWLLRYRANGSQSDKTVGKAWIDLELWRKRREIKLLQSRPRTGYLTRAQAEAEAQKFLDDRSLSVPEDRRTVERARREYLSVCEEKGRRGSTLHGYRALAKRLCALPYDATRTWGEMPVAAIGLEHVAMLLGDLEDRSLAPDTKNHWRTVAKGILGPEVIAQWRWLTPQIEARGSFQFYSPEELALLGLNARDEIDRAIFILAAEAGLRMSEIAGLPVKNVRFAIGGRAVNKLLITQAYTQTGGMAGPKSHEIRSVPMSENVQAALAPHCADKPDEALVFCRDGKLDEPMCSFGIYRRFKSASRRAGIPELRFHDLRHSFGSLAIQDFTPVEVQDMMGHADLKTTQRYLHVKEDPHAAAKLSARFVPQDATLARLPGPAGGRPARFPGGCPKCGAAKAPGQPYCAEHQREARQASAARAS